MKPFPLFALTLSIAPLAFAQSQYARDVLALNPAGYWPLHSNVQDASGRGLNGQPRPDLMYFGAVGPLGVSAAPAAAFTSRWGTHVRIAAPDGSPLNLENRQAMTALAWVRTMSQTEDFMSILGKFSLDTGAGWAIGIDNGGLGGPQGAGRFALAFAVNGDPTLAVESTVSVTDGGWHFFAATYDGSGAASGVRLYMDGVRLATTTLVDRAASGSIRNSAPVTIGGFADDNSNFEGYVNEVAFFPTVLTPEQILQLMMNAQGIKRVLPAVAFGGEWSTAIYFTNSSTSALSFPLSFFGDDGKPLDVPSLNGSSTTVALRPGESKVVPVTSSGPETVGYAVAILPVGVSGYEVVRQTPANGGAPHETIGQFNVAGAGFQSFSYDDSGSLVTLVALVNPNPVAVTVAVTAFDASGAKIGEASFVLDPSTRRLVPVRQIPGLEKIEGGRGNVQFVLTAPTNGTGSISALGIRLDGTIFSVIGANGRARGDF
jgi:hypothetical protein